MISAYYWNYLFRWNIHSQPRYISAMADLPVEHSESSGFDSWLRDWLPHWCLCAMLLSTFSRP